MIRHFWAHHRLAVMAFVVALLAVGWFGFQTVRHALYWHDPAHQDQPLAGWMTPRYVVESYQIPPEVLAPALFLNPDEKPRRLSLDTIADQNDVTLTELQSRIDAAVAEWRLTHPEPGQ